MSDLEYCSECGEELNKARNYWHHVTCSMYKSSPTPPVVEEMPEPYFYCNDEDPALVFLAEQAGPDVDTQEITVPTDHVRAVLKGYDRLLRQLHPERFNAPLPPSGEMPSFVVSGVEWARQCCALIPGHEKSLQRVIVLLADALSDARYDLMKKGNAAAVALNSAKWRGDKIKELQAALQSSQQRAEELQEERDLAIAHDRQPYPTAEAYERVCKARDGWQRRAVKAHEVTAERFDIIIKRDREIGAMQKELTTWRWLHWGQETSWACHCGNTNGHAVDRCDDCGMEQPRSTQRNET